MDHENNLRFLQQMLLDCCGLWSWTINRNFRIIATNCPEPDPMDGILLSRQKQEGLERHMTRSRMPLMLGGNFGLTWIAAFQPDETGEIGLIHVLGPVFHTEVSNQTLKEMVQGIGNISFSQGRRIWAGLRRVPVISSLHMLQNAIYLHYSVTGEKIGIHDLVHFDPRLNERGWTEQTSTPPHSPLSNEKMLLDMVRLGNVNYHNAIANAASSSYGIRARGGDPVQLGKFNAVAFLTLCTRAAIEGGLPSDTAYTLSDTYTEAIDKCKTLTELMTLNHTMYDDLVHRVNNCRSDGNSQTIRACREYVKTHVEEKITTQQLAELTGYSDYYLTRKFKKEMGTSLAGYIRWAKIQRAKLLLTSTNLSVEEIARRLQFSSRSYFTDTFQKVEGISPSDYRAAQQKS